MSEMLERAAKAMFAEEHKAVSGIRWENEGEFREFWRNSARAALLAALDPEDRELVEVHAMAGVSRACRAAPEGSSLSKLLFSQRRAIAQEVVAALKAAAQGETAPKDPAPPQA